jgi:hypothetical protein
LIYGGDNYSDAGGWITSVEAWLEAHRLRNRMIHEQVRDAAESAAALNLVHGTVPVLEGAAAGMCARVLSACTGR